MPFDPNKPFQDDPTQAVPAPSMREQLLASLQARMAPVPPPDTSEQENAALSNRASSGLVRAGTQLSNAIMGRQSNGDNQFSQNLDEDAKRQLAEAAEKKRMASEMDKRREELRNGLSTRFVDDENLVARDKTKFEHDDAEKAKDRDVEREKIRSSAHTAEMNKNLVAGAKADSQLDKDEQTFAKALDPSVGRAGLKGQLGQQLVRAENAKALIYEPDGKLKNLNSEQMAEAASAWARLVGGNNVTADAAIQRLMPNTAVGHVADLKQWLTNEPQGANQQQFLQLMADTIDREDEVNQRKLKEFQVQSSAGFGKLKGARPEVYNQILRSNGIMPEDVDANGHYSPKPKTPQFPMQLKNAKGQIATVSDEHELAEANKEGFK